MSDEGAFPLEDRFALLCGITRAAHFEWRRAALALSPDVDPMALVGRYWEEVGHDTAAAYLRRIDRERPLPRQVAELFVSSSLAMGERAEVRPSEGPGEVLLVHTGCPWPAWHERYQALAEDRPGCDRWLATVCADIGEALGVRLRFETLESLPEGGATCTRRLWVEE